MVPITAGRKAQLDDYAQRRGQDTAAALDGVLAEALEWERQDYNETVAAVTEACRASRPGARNPPRSLLKNSA